MARSPYGISPNTRFQGPVTGSKTAGGGLYENLPLGALDLVRSKYKFWMENFAGEFADGQLLELGATVTDIGAVAANTEVVTSESGFLLLNPGTAADTGVEVQHNIPPTGAGLQNALNTPNGITSTTTLMDGRELIWGCRFGIQSDSTAWDGKVIMGWISTDTSLMSPTTGLPTIQAGGGAGLHISELGVISAFGQNGALTTSGPITAGFPNVVALAAANTFQWYEFGFRWKCLDASSGTGSMDFFFNNRFVGNISSGLPMQGTVTYSTTFGVINGPAQLADLAVDYVFTAITGAGR